MKHIDIEKYIRESDYTLLKRLPRFIIRFFIWIIKQDEINRILNKLSQDTGISFHEKVISTLNIKLEVEGLENLPKDSRCFFVSNHPFGIIDGLVLTKTIAEKYGTFRAIGNDVFMLIPNLRPYIVEVNVFGKNNRKNINALDEVFSSDLAITHFPAGEVSRVYHGRIQDCPWQKSFISKAISKKRDVVPIYFYGRNSRFFYFLNIFRKVFHIKLNIELMLLPRELFRKKGKTIRVKIGHPIPYQTFTVEKSHFEWAQWVREETYNIRK